MSSPTADSNYSPISLLTIISKVFERIILNQLKESLDQHHVLCSTQSGYHKAHCVTILHKLNNDIQTLNKGEMTLAIMVDYSKAFDTATYSTLVKTLKVIKFSNSFIDL